MAAQHPRAPQRWRWPSLALGALLALGLPALAARVGAPGTGGGGRSATLSNRGFSLALMALGPIPIDRAMVLVGSDQAMPADRRLRPVSDRFLLHRTDEEVRAAVHQLAGTTGGPAAAAELVLLSARFPRPECQRHDGQTFCVAGVMQVPQLPFEAGRFVMAVDFSPPPERADCHGYQPVFIGQSIDWNRFFRWEAASAAQPGNAGRCRMVIFGGCPEAFILSGDGHPDVALFVIPRGEEPETQQARLSPETSAAGPAPGQLDHGR